MSDEAELEDHIRCVMATAIQGASDNFPAAARRDFPADTDGKTTLGAYLRSNQVSDHLAEAVLAALLEHGFRIEAPEPVKLDRS